MRINGQKIYINEIFDFLDDLEWRGYILKNQDGDDLSYEITSQGIRTHLPKLLRDKTFDKQKQIPECAEAIEFEDHKLVLTKHFLILNRKEGQKVDK